MQRAKAPTRNTNSENAWIKPLVGMIKYNVDATAFNNNYIMGHGMCFCDSMGVLLLGKSDFYYSSATVLKAESLGLLDAIKVAISH